VTANASAIPINSLENSQTKPATKPGLTRPRGTGGGPCRQADQARGRAEVRLCAPQGRISDHHRRRNKNRRAGKW
jgi:hypothetical protein